MNVNPHQVTKDFERALCEYTGAPYAVAVNSCTMALLLAVAWRLRDPMWNQIHGSRVEIPKRTYVSVPMSIIHAGGRPVFRDEEWRGYYQLSPLRIWDSARWFSGSMFDKFLPQSFVCVSFHWSKTLGIQQGGAILHDNYAADQWLRRARFDGRTEGVPPSMDIFSMVGWHAYMSPEVAAEGLVRLSFLPKQNDPLPNDNYPDLSKFPIFSR